MATIETSIVDGALQITVEGHSPIVVRPSDFATAIKEAATLHGFKQKIVDAAALSRDADTGKSATPAQKYHAMQEVVDQLAGGDWNRRAESDGMAGLGLLAKALVRVTGQSPETIAATVKGWTKEQQAAMRDSAQIAPVIAAIKAERSANRPEVAKIDVGGLMAGLMGAPKAETGGETAAETPKTKGKKAIAA